jgi:hypothetical protein
MSQYLKLYFWMECCVSAICNKQRRMAKNPYSSFHAADWHWAKPRITAIYLGKFYLILAQRAA